MSYSLYLMKPKITEDGHYSEDDEYLEIAPITTALYEKIAYANVTYDQELFDDDGTPYQQPCISDLYIDETIRLIDEEFEEGNNELNELLERAKALLEKRKSNPEERTILMIG